MGYKSIAMALNSEGYQTNQGHRFRVMFISRTLRNRAYIGIFDYNRHQGRGEKERSQFLDFILLSSIRNCLSVCKRNSKMKLNSFKTPLRIEPTISKSARGL